MLLKPVERRVLQQPALMIAVNPLFHGDFASDAGHRAMWMRRVGDGTEDDG
jgi:hypothetical protein